MIVVAKHVNPCYCIFLLAGFGDKTFCSFTFTLTVFCDLFVFSRRDFGSFRDNIVSICNSNKSSRTCMKWLEFKSYFCIVMELTNLQLEVQLVKLLIFFIQEKIFLFCFNVS